MRRHGRETTSTEERVCTEMPVSDFSLLIGNPNFSPECNVTIIDNYLNYLEQNLNAHQYRIIMLGDF
jgi:hypothetical protein